MRSADIITLFRGFLVFPIIYLILIKFNPLITILLIIFMFALDGIDGFAAIKDSKAKITFKDYIYASLGNKVLKEKIKKLKLNISKTNKYGARLDIASDRTIEYVFWILFTYLNIIPLFIIFIVVIRNSFVDALMAAKGTSSKMKSKIAKAFYSSNLSRSTSTLLKVFAFSYLALVYIANYPLFYGQIIVALLIIFIIIRGIAEIYEGIINIE
ncbi:MAG: hypothetical protein ACP5UN_00350 [Candidatus Micrarchaeia archaeon]